MARSSKVTATPVQTPDFTFEQADILHELHDDAERTWLAMQAIVQLLNGCESDHRIDAGPLLCLLEPISSSVETLCCDIGMAKNHFLKPRSTDHGNH